MKRLFYVLASVAIGGVAMYAPPVSASPLAGGSVGGNSSEISEGLVQKVHGWHCRRKFGWYRGDKYWHRHRKACYSSRYYGAPTFGFGMFIDDDDDHHGRRHHFKRKKKGY
jgi:hypothetical protein